MTTTTTTTTTTATELSESGDSSKSTRTAADPMFDSGFSGSLRLSLQGSMSLDKETSEEISTSSSSRRQEEICHELGQLSLGGGGEEGEAWREYYEPDEDGDVQLHLAIASGFVEVVHALVRLAPHPDYLNIQNRAMYAPLHIAVLQNQPGLVRRLVIAGARLEVRDREGNTPLHLAARRGSVQCGEALLKPVSVQELATNSATPATAAAAVDVIDLRNMSGEHCAHLAAMGGHTHFLRFLCWSHADMGAADGRAGRSALHFAAGARNLAAVRCLVDSRAKGGCGVDVNQQDWYGRTAYQLAATNECAEVATFLARSSAAAAAAGGGDGCDQMDSSDGEEEDEEVEEDGAAMCSRGSSVLLDSSA